MTYLGLWAESRWAPVERGVTHSGDEISAQAWRDTGAPARRAEMQVTVQPTFAEWCTDFVVEDGQGRRFAVEGTRAQVAAPGRAFSWRGTDFAAQDVAALKLGLEAAGCVGLHYVGWTLTGS